MDLFFEFLKNTGYYIVTSDYRYLIMIAVGILFCYLSIAKEYETVAAAGR